MPQKKNVVKEFINRRNRLTDMGRQTGNGNAAKAVAAGAGAGASAAVTKPKKRRK